MHCWDNVSVNKNENSFRNIIFTKNCGIESRKMSNLICLQLVTMFHLMNCDIISTGLSTGKQFSGQMFDVISNFEPLKITRLDIHVNKATKIKVNIYKKTNYGSYILSENISHDWSLIHSEIINSSDSSLITKLSDLNTPVIILPHYTQAFYVDIQYSLLQHGISTSLLSGDVYAADKHIKILVGSSKKSLFGESVKNTIWNGVVWYDVMCDKYTVINDGTEYTLNAYQTKDPAKIYVLCFQIAPEYICESPNIKIITKGIDYDRNEEYLTIQYFKNGIRQLAYPICNTNKFGVCGDDIICVDEYANDTVWNAGLLYYYQLENSPAVDKFCNPARSMDCNVTIKCDMMVIKDTTTDVKTTVFLQDLNNHQTYIMQHLWTIIIICFVIFIFCVISIWCTYIKINQTGSKTTPNKNKEMIISAETPIKQINAENDIILAANAPDINITNEGEADMETDDELYDIPGFQQPTSNV